MQNYQNEIESAMNHIKPSMFVPNKTMNQEAKGKWVHAVGQDLAKVLNETHWFSAQWNGNEVSIKKRGDWQGSSNWHGTITMEPNAQEHYLGLHVKFFDAAGKRNGKNTEEVDFFVNWSNPNVQPFVSCMKKELTQEAAQNKKF